MRKTLLYFPLLLICSLMIGSSIQAQIVNVESKRSSEDTDGWNGSLGLDFNYTKNTTEIFDYGASGALQYVKERHRLLFFSDISRIKAGGADFINNGYEHIRYNYDLGSKRRFAAEAFQQAQFNTIQLIQFRHLSGAGIRWNIIDNDSLRFWAGTLPMYEYEELTTGIIERNFRESTYFLFFFARKRFEFQTINYYQPRMDDWSDYRFSSNTTMEFGVLKWLRFVTSVDLLFDSNVPKSIPGLIVTLQNGVKLEF